MEIQTVRDHAQEIAVREAGQIARWQQVQALADALISAARRYIKDALPVPRSSYQNAADRSCAYSDVEYLLLRTITAIRFSLDIEEVKPEEILTITNDLHNAYKYLSQGIEAESAHLDELPNPEVRSADSPQTMPSGSNRSALAAFLDEECV